MWWWLPAIGAALFGAAVVYYNWDDIKKWFADVLREVSNVIREIGKRFGPKTRYATEVVAILIDKVADEISIEHVLVYEDPKTKELWGERSKSKIKRNELPKRLRDKLYGIQEREERNIDKEMEIETGLRI